MPSSRIWAAPLAFIFLLAASVLSPGFAEEQGGARVFYLAISCRDAKNLAFVRSGVSKPTEAALSITNKVVDPVVKIWKSVLNESNVVAELIVPILLLAQRPTKSNVFGQDFGHNCAVERVPHFLVEPFNHSLEMAVHSLCAALAIECYSASS